ncbi:MAG: hypothetical protein JXP34_26195 [Planctomycetes bacterium]|nr:hypothetical protein [Planctomycetota bacterium]
MRACEADREAARERSIESLRNAPYWAISAVLHLILLLILGAYVMYAPQPHAPEHVLRVHRDVRPPVVAPREEPDPIIPALVPPDRPDDRPKPEIPAPESDLPERPSGNPTDEVDRDDFAWMPDYGLGGGGPYRHRRGDLGSGQGTGAGIDQVRRALEWLRRHQNPDGSWSARDFAKRCDPALDPCADKGKGPGSGRGFPSHDVGVTALALLAFTGRGETHFTGEHREVVRRGMRWLKENQVLEGDPDDRGRFGSPQIRIREWTPESGADPYEIAFDEQWIYDHALATMAMAELLLLTDDRIGLDKSVGLAADLCLRAQNDGYGWRYGIKPGDNDTSVTGWMILALKACKYAAPRGIVPARLEKSFTDALEWFRRATSTNGVTGYRAPGDEGSRLSGIYPEPYPYSKEPSCMTAVAVLCRLFSGESRRDPAIRKGIGVLLREKPVWQEAAGARPSRVNLYYWYYATYALFQYGGLPWKEWNERMLEALLRSQRTDGCARGSWDPIGEWGAAGGRVYATALGAMTLEVYYRYARAQDGKGF